METPEPARRGGPGWGALSPGRRPHLLNLAAVIPSPGQPALAKGAGGREALTPTCLVRVPPTFGPCEEQLIRGVQAEDGLGVALGHGDALQRGRPRAPGSSDRGDDAPSRERGREAPVSPGSRPG